MPHADWCVSFISTHPSIPSYLVYKYHTGLLMLPTPCFMLPLLYLSLAPLKGSAFPTTLLFLHVLLSCNYISILWYSCPVLYHVLSRNMNGLKKTKNYSIQLLSYHKLKKPRKTGKPHDLFTNVLIVIDKSQASHAPVRVGRLPQLNFKLRTFYFFHFLFLYLYE